MKIRSFINGVTNLQLCEKLEEDFSEPFDTLMDKVRGFVRGKLVGNKVRDFERNPGVLQIGDEIRRMESQTPNTSMPETSTKTRILHTKAKIQSWKGHKRCARVGEGKDRDKHIDSEYVDMIRKDYNGGDAKRIISSRSNIPGWLLVPIAIPYVGEGNDQQTPLNITADIAGYKIDSPCRRRQWSRNHL
ncbi:hypothetical protein QVD17_00253 [Tagetes erecta]|uniref:Uncharacterized protein n=1 Tax=Tagetes erecta TaxID=13708 RepID=A0AAD8L2Y1_TARER|nr:hypothetical protein QVD17_00253 [Tagetes erecta]